MTQDTRAFELREDVDADTFGGSVTLADGTAYNVGEALDENDGVIVTNDPRLIGALDLYPALKRAGVPEGALPVEASDYEEKTKDDLLSEIERRNADRDDDDTIEVAAPGNKPEIIAALVADDQNESE